MKPKDVREHLGVSRRHAARLVGVNRTTLALFEADEDEVKDPEIKAKLLRFYAGLTRLLEQCADHTTRAA